MRFKTVCWMLACGTAVLAGAFPAWAAGEDEIDGAIKVTKVTITKIKDGKVFYLNVSGEEKPYDLAGVKKLSIKDQPKFTSAEDEFATTLWLPAARDYDDAAKRFNTPDKAGLRDYCYEKMMKAYVKAKAFDKMLDSYGAFHNLSAAAADAAVPQDKPVAGTPEMTAAIKTLENRYASARVTADKVFWGNLLVGYYTENQQLDKANKIQEELTKIAEKAPPPVPGKAPEPGATPKTALPATQEGRLLIQKLEIMAKAEKPDWDGILKEIDANSEKAGEQQLGDLQYFRGLAQFNLKQYPQAGVSFMWVWTCGYINSPRRYWGLYYTGQVYEKLNKAKTAKDIYTELIGTGRKLPPDLKPEVEKALKALGG